MVLIINNDLKPDYLYTILNWSRVIIERNTNKRIVCLGGLQLKELQFSLLLTQDYFAL